MLTLASESQGEHQSYTDVATPRYIAINWLSTQQISRLQKWSRADSERSLNKQMLYCVTSKLDNSNAQQLQSDGRPAHHPEIAQSGW